jgi:cob(I)alamin adenosyltransferase
MVRLTKIYTRGGDGGETSLGDGRRVAKTDIRVAAFGTVDEANAAIGLARMELIRNRAAKIKAIEWGGERSLSRIQNDLFDLGADLCTPEEGSKGEGALRINADQVTWLEAEIDRLNEELEPLASFILPGGAPVAATLHLARTVTRRAERLVIELAARERVNPEALKYLNRLSDVLFVMARTANGGGKKDVLWVPGGSR